MSSHHDSPSGQQFHIRYEPPHDPGRVYWSEVFDDLDEARRSLVRNRSYSDPNAKIFVRDVSPWREQA